jgi:hypothetical protein
LINPDLLADPVRLGFAASYTTLAVAVFIWPLWGIHRLIRMQKAQALREVEHRFEAVLAKFNQLVDDADHAEAGRLNGTIASLQIQHKRICAIPTWPWSPETARIALTAIVLPLTLMILQFLVLQALNR